MEDGVVESELRGKTMLVYMYMLRNPRKPVGVREVQRSLGFSSPSVSSYHLNKLVDLGLVENIHGDYRVRETVKVGVLKQFVTLRGVFLPRLLFYAVLTTTMLATFLLKTPYAPTPEYFTALTMGLVSAGAFWFETLRAWRELPR